MRLLALAAVACLVPAAAAAAPAADAGPREAPPPAWTKRLFFGGSAAASFGAVDAVAAAPLVGYRVTSRVSVGAQPFYRYAKYKDVSPHVTTHDYGADVFARVRVVGGFFVQGQYEWIDYDAVTASGATRRRSASTTFAGVGYTVGAGPVGVYVVALYDLGYDGRDPLRPYDGPWLVQAGVAVGF